MADAARLCGRGDGDTHARTDAVFGTETLVRKGSGLFDHLRRRREFASTASLLQEYLRHDLLRRRFANWAQRVNGRRSHGVGERFGGTAVLLAG